MLTYNTRTLSHRDFCHGSKPVFGRYYVEYDRAIAGEGTCGPTSPATYATVLLAELLDRAAVLRDIAECSAAEEIDAMALWRGVELFVRDADEARIRAIRARLLTRTHLGSLDPWSIDPTDTLADVSGPIANVS